jgi:hypothetical protein
MGSFWPQIRSQFGGYLDQVVQFFPEFFNWFNAPVNEEKIVQNGGHLFSRYRISVHFWPILTNKCFLETSYNYLS